MFCKKVNTIKAYQIIICLTNKKYDEFWQIHWWQQQ